MPQTDQKHLIERLPQSGPMRLIDSVVRLDARSVETLSHFDPRRSWLRGGRSGLDSYLGIELIAQSAAFPLLHAAGPEAAREGMIVQIRSFRSHSGPLADAPTLRTTCEVELLMGGELASVVGWVRHEGDLLCEAEILLALEESK